MISEVKNNLKFYEKQLSQKLFFPQEANFLAKLNSLENKSISRHSTISYKPDVIKYILTSPDCLENLLYYYKNCKGSVLEVDEFQTPKIARKLFAINNSDLYLCLKNELENVPLEKRALAEEYLGEIEKQLSADVLLENNDDYTIKIEDRTVSDKICNIAKFFLGGYKKFLSIDASEIDQETKDKLYLALCYAKENGIFQKYLFSKDAKEFYDLLQSNGFVDFFGIDTLNEITNNYTRGIKISEDIERYIFDNIPANFSDLQKSIYIYFKLCQAFQYDAGLYASSQNGKALDYHKNPNLIPLISLQNNELDCCEFHAIFGELLEKIGVNYTYKTSYREYCGGHVSTMLKADSLVFEVEPLESVLSSDFFSAKFDKRVKGLRLQNDNPVSKEVFRQSISEVTRYIANNEEDSALYRQFEHFKELYESVADDVQVSRAEKFDILQTQMHALEENDKLSRILYLKKICDRLFETEKQNDTFELLIMGDRVEDCEQTEYMPVVVLTFKNGEDKYTYVKYDSNEKFDIITREKFIDEIKKKNMVFINEQRKISGIDSEEILGHEND